MTAATEPGERIVNLDVLRGLAVMGILAMNIVAFSMPFQAYVNPRVHGGAEGADLWAWIISFIFVDGKMRAMFSMLFGASMLLVLHGAALKGEDPGKTHARRMAWLLIFGLIHFFFIWFGDILNNYALVGLFAYLFATRPPKKLIRLSILFFVIGLFMSALAFLTPLALQMAASEPNAAQATVAQWREIETSIMGSPAAIRQDLAIYGGSYFDIVRHTFTERAAQIPSSLIVFGPETLALMLLGMWGLKSGFLEGKWERRRYLKVAAICLAITIPGYAYLASRVVEGNFELPPLMVYGMFLPTLLRPVMMVGYAALIVFVLTGSAGGAIRSRIAATGRAAFTNYLGTSIVATFIFYGWGLGLYGTLTRSEIYLVVLGIWVVMLLWSKPWLERYRYGPLEWLWRSLARGSAQPMRRRLVTAAVAAE